MLRSTERAPAPSGLREGEVVLHLDVAPPEASPEGANELGALQLFRALHKPLLADPAHPAYAIADVVEEDAARTRLRIRAECRWHAGPRVTAAEVAHGVAGGLVRLRGMARLFGLDPEGVAADGERDVILRTRAHHPLLRKLLAHASFTPKGSGHGQGTGAFVRDEGGGYRAHRGGGKLRVAVEASGAAALRAHAQGTISITAPSCFEVAHLAGGSARPCTPDLHAYLFVHPRRAPALATAEARAALGAAMGFAHIPGFVRRPLPPGLADPRPTVLPPRLKLLHSPYWPNADLAEGVAAGLGALGVAAVVEPVPLLELVARFQKFDFEVALVIVHGGLGATQSLPVLLGAIGMLGGAADARDALVRTFDAAFATPTGAPSPDAEAEFERAVLRTVPVLPLGRFASGYLASPSIPDVPLVDGCIYPVELLANARPDVPAPGNAR